MCLPIYISPATDWRTGQAVPHLSPRDNWDGLQGRNCGSYVQIIFQDDGSYIAPLFNTKYDFIMPECPQKMLFPSLNKRLED